MPGKPQTDLTALLLAWRGGDARAGNALMSAVYHDLHHQARAYLRREPAGRSLSPTGLVHEAYLRLVDQRRVEWRSRAHFYALAAQAMRRVLVDHAPARRFNRHRKAGLDGGARMAVSRAARNHE